MSEEIEDDSFEEMDDDFEGEVADDLDVDVDVDDEEIDIGDLDEDVPGDFDDDGPRRRGGGGGSSRDADLAAVDYEQAIKANPKRQEIQRKRARMIEGVLDTAELTTEEGSAKAWKSLQKQAGDAKPRKFSVKDEYTENDIIEHPKFGEGYVVEILTATKISVLFQEGLKRLAHNRQ